LNLDLSFKDITHKNKALKRKHSGGLMEVMIRFFLAQGLKTNIKEYSICQTHEYKPQIRCGFGASQLMPSAALPDFIRY